MRLHIHVTTCNRTDVQCRPRPHESSSWNVKPWTNKERIDISKTSVNSIRKFADQVRSHGHEVTLTILDDGSNIKEAKLWLDQLEMSDPNLIVKQWGHNGSSSTINGYFQGQDIQDEDYILHIEDDHILFNPNNIDWLTIVDNLRNKSENVKVFTFRSGLPFEINDKGYHGSWGPIGCGDIDQIHYVLYHNLGNAHHVVQYKDYKKFLPLKGNTGDCEAYMNQILHTFGFNAEPQIHVHAFHSHMWEYPIDSNVLTKWHKSAEGFEYGIKNMDAYLKSRQPVISELYTVFPNKKSQTVLENYAY